MFHYLLEMRLDCDGMEEEFSFEEESKRIRKEDDPKR